MTLFARTHPVQLLHDARGIYGIGVVGCEVEEGRGEPAEIILRPDRLLEAGTRAAALQMITGGFRHGMFSRMMAERLRQAIHWEMLRRKGLNWPPRSKWWSDDAQEQARNREIYHGLRLNSLAAINRLIGGALQAAAEPHALALARRFQFYDRYEIYRATAVSRRALQFVNVFPALGLAIFGTRSHGVNVTLVPEAKRLVEGGAPLRKTAELMGVPIAFRSVKPGAARLALAVADAFEDPRLIGAYMPESLTEMKVWLKCIYLAQHVGPDFVAWTSRHATEIGGSHEATSILRDIADWVQACYRASVPAHIKRAIIGHAVISPAQGEQFVYRPFNADMSLTTVSKLSVDWHDAVADNMSGPNSEFPEPWCPGGASADLEIVPITSSADLYREGKLLHHCAGTYAGQVHSGDCYIFSVRKDGAPLATLHLVRGEVGVAIGQLRGMCNARPSKEILRVVNSWLRAQREFRFPERTPYGLVDDDIPF
jgi:PcfJ-like protein